MCGKTFYDDGQSECCSEECKRERKLEACREHRRNNKAADERAKKMVETKRVVKKPTMTLEEVNQLAREEGLSYGKYVGKYGLY
ncbi:MAG: hypothetical protein ACLT3H_02700 [Roseburia sp.]